MKDATYLGHTAPHTGHIVRSAYPSAEAGWRAFHDTCNRTIGLHSVLALVGLHLKQFDEKLVSKELQGYLLDLSVQAEGFHTYDIIMRWIGMGKVAPGLWKDGGEVSFNSVCYRLKAHTSAKRFLSGIAAGKFDGLLLQSPGPADEAFLAELEKRDRYPYLPGAPVPLEAADPFWDVFSLLPYLPNTKTWKELVQPTVPREDFLPPR